MKLIAGELSNTPSRPHTGLVGIMIRHREQLEHGSKITGSAAVQLLATARAIVEALGGKQVDGQWEVDLPHSIINEVRWNSGPMETIFDTFRNALDGLDARLSSLAADGDASIANLINREIPWKAGVENHLAHLELELDVVKEAPGYAARLADLEARVYHERDVQDGAFLRTMGQAGDRFERLESRLAALENPPHGELITLEAVHDNRIELLIQRNADLERTVEELAAAVTRLEAAVARIETRAKPGPKPKG